IAGGDVGVGEDVPDGVGDAEGDLVALEDLLYLRGGPLAAPGGDDAVDLVAVGSARRHGRKARIAEEVLAAHRTTEAREEAVAGGDDADVLPVAGLPVVERRRVPEAIPLALADDAEPVVGGERVLHDA